jgi:hypothetical protein
MVSENRNKISSMVEIQSRSTSLVVVPKNWPMDSFIKLLKLMQRKLLTSPAPMLQSHTSSEEIISHLPQSFQTNPTPKVSSTSTSKEEVGNS